MVQDGLAVDLLDAVRRRAVRALGQFLHGVALHRPLIMARERLIDSSKVLFSLSFLSCYLAKHENSSFLPLKILNIYTIHCQSDLRK